MKVKLQYTDHSEWEDLPEKGHESPDKGIIRMIITDDHGYILNFVYQDIYYFYKVAEGWLFGACTPNREFIIKPREAGCNGEERPFELPDGAVIRHGETVSQEEAVVFGLIETADEKVLHPKKRITVKKCKDCN